MANATIRKTGLSAPTPAGNKKKVNLFHQRLGSLTYSQACSLLGNDGAALIAQGGGKFEIQYDRDVFLGGDLYRVRVADASSLRNLAATLAKLL